MKTLLTLSIILILLATIGYHLGSRGVTGGEVRDVVHMNRVSQTLAGVDPASTGVTARGSINRVTFVHFL